MDLDRRQHIYPTACVIAQQLFPTLSCHCSLFPEKENLFHVYKMLFFQIFIVFKLSKSKIV